MASLLLMCDPRDLGTAMTEDISGSLTAWEPNLYLYDAYAGGVGLSAPLYELCHRLLKQSRELIEACACEAGCPACVGPAGEIGDRGKQLALEILRKLTETSTAILSEPTEPRKTATRGSDHVIAPTAALSAPTEPPTKP